MLHILLHFLSLTVITGCSDIFNAQSNLTGFFWIQNSISQKVLDVGMGSTEPGANVLLWERKRAGFDNQLWKYEDEVFINKHSNLVLCVPSFGGHVIAGTPLLQAEPINQDDPKDRYEKSWGVDPQGRIFSWLDEGFCVAPGEGVSVVVEDCFSGDVENMVWKFVPVLDF